MKTQKLRYIHVRLVYFEEHSAYCSNLILVSSYCFLKCFDSWGSRVNEFLFEVSKIEAKE